MVKPGAGRIINFTSHSGLRVENLRDKDSP
jgi:hypothetical protein